MEENLIDRLVQKNYVSDIRRFAIGAGLAASIGAGWPAFVATALVATVISGVEFHYDRKSKQKALLGLYKDEIAELEHKNPKDLTIDDLKKAAQPIEKGGHGITAIKEGLQRYDWDKKFRWGVNLGSSLIVTAILVAAAVAIPAFLANVHTILGLGLVGFGYVAVNRTLRAASEMAFGYKDRDEHFNQQLIDIENTIKKEPVSPLLVFRQFAEAHPRLKTDIKERFGASFNDLTVMQKRQAIDYYEPDHRVVALTNEINEGRIKPSIIGFLAHGQSPNNISEVQKYSGLFTHEVHSVSHSEKHYESQRSFARRIDEERQKTTEEKTLH